MYWFLSPWENLSRFPEVTSDSENTFVWAIFSWYDAELDYYNFPAPYLYQVFRACCHFWVFSQCPSGGTFLSHSFAALPPENSCPAWYPYFKLFHCFLLFFADTGTLLFSRFAWLIACSDRPRVHLTDWSPQTDWSNQISSHWYLSRFFWTGTGSKYGRFQSPMGPGPALDEWISRVCELSQPPTVWWVLW